jgi:hypothetical protein
VKQISKAAMFLCMAYAALNAQWVQTSGPSEHTVLSLAICDTVLIAGTYSGAYISTDNGGHWAAAGSINSLGTRILSLVVMNNLVFAGTDAGVCRSSDNGTSWKAVDSGMPDRSLVHSLAVSGTNVYAGTHAQGVFLSVDSGATWTAINSGLPAATSAYSLFARGNQVIAGTWGAGIFRSANNGTTWTVANSGLPAIAIGGYAFSLVSCGADLFAAIGSGIYSSGDNGMNWSSVRSSQIFSDVYSLTTSGPDLFAATYSDGVFYSADYGLSWTAINTGLPVNNQGLCLLTSGAFLFFGTGNNGVFRRSLSEISSVKSPIDSRSRQLGFKATLSNRFDHSITFEFSLPRSQTVSILMYTISGSKIPILDNRRFDAGAHRISCGSRAMVPGYYMVKMKAEACESFQNIMVVK